jgi:hypothetical protein
MEDGMENKLELRPGGRLIKTFWRYDEEKEQGSWLTQDVTESAISLLFEECVLAEGATLRDLFLLIKPDATIFDSIFRNWVEDIVAEGLSSGPSPDPSPAASDIEFLELYWSFECQKRGGKNTINGTTFPYFHGIGRVLERDEEHYKKGDRIAWSLSFTSTRSLIDLPLRLKPDATVFTDNMDDWKEESKTLATYHWVPTTLGQIIQGVFWELSFFGSPVERDKQGAELFRSIEEVRDGNAETVPFDDVFSEFLDFDDVFSEFLDKENENGSGNDQ